MPSVQQGYSTRACASVPKWLQLKINVVGIEQEKVDELERRLNELQVRLEEDTPDIRGRICVKRI